MVNTLKYLLQKKLRSFWVYDLEGLFSRRINRKHRLIYGIHDEIVAVVVLSPYAHYGAK